MTNTYAINTTRGREFAVEAELQDMGLKPWVPRQLCVKHVKEKKEAVWYDRPYVGKLMFCVFPAVYYRDVAELKHVIGKPFSLSQKDIDGQPAFTVLGTDVRSPAISGLRDFQKAVDAEYSDMQRKRENAEWVCAHQPGDALRILGGAFEGFAAVFKDSIRRAQDDFAQVRVELDVFGRTTTVSLPPDMVVAS